MTPGALRHYSVGSNGNGELRLIRIPPGEYVLAVNPAEDRVKRALRTAADLVMWQMGRERGVRLPCSANDLDGVCQ